MFISAIEKVSQFTRPIHTIMRNYGSRQLVPGASTLFFVNEKGAAVTCKHVAEMLISADQINKKYFQFREEKKNSVSHKLSLLDLESRYQYKTETTIQLKNNFIDSVDKLTGFDIHLHPTLDLAIVQFKGFGKVLYRNCALFAKDPAKIRQGKFLCRLGFPFPEFNNFALNEDADDINWTNTGISASPIFPIEGMITRFLGDPQNGLFGIEMSTPGLRGQSGGPLFDENGTIYGMQFSTKHLHLGFDIENLDIMVNNSMKKISDYSFIHLGQCIHVDIIKNFLRQYNIAFYEN